MDFIERENTTAATPKCTPGVPLDAEKERGGTGNGADRGVVVCLRNSRSPGWGWGLGGKEMEVIGRKHQSPRLQLTEGQDFSEWTRV